MKNLQSISNPVKSRRNFLRNTSGFLFYISVPIGLSSLNACSDLNSRDIIPEYKAGAESKAQELNLWVQIHENDNITIMSPTNEMGQGSMTALSVIIAEELDADWSKVSIENSPVEVDLYGSPGWRGKSMMTVGSRTIMTYYDSLRQAGAQARFVLLTNVADHWNVPIEELSTAPNKVIHANSKKEISFGKVATFLKPLDDIPVITESQLKDPKNFRLIGKNLERFDIPFKVNGSAMYAIDVQIPNMVYGVISRSPVHGSSPELLNEQEIMDIEGVTDIIKLDHGIGVIASTIELALKTKEKLQIRWSKGAKAESHTSEEAYAEYEKVANNNSMKGNIMVNEGNFKSAFQSGARTFSSDYKNDYIYHAQMEPVNAIASFDADNSSVEIWVGTQSPGNTKSAIARMLDIDPSKVTMHRQYLGGGFGRKATSDWVIEAVHLAKESGKPVKLIWTREDDLQYGMFRPMSLQRMQASKDNSGKITGWKHSIYGPGAGLLGSGAETQFYSFPNQHVEVINIDHGIRTKHWRSVGHGANKFAIESFVDELAEDQNIDPVAFRLNLMEKFPRAQKVLQTAADMANWNSPSPNGRAKGIAFAERSSSLAACVCELSVNRDDGRIIIHKLWASLDAGVVIQPDNAIAQMEGGLIMGISSILKESITFKNGRVQQSNYYDYPILRIDEIPESIEIKIIPSLESPTGIGESAVPVIGGAIANAFAKLTGKRLKHLPFTPEKVLKILNG